MIDQLYFHLFAWYHAYHVSSSPAHSSVGSVQDLRTGGRWFKPPDRPISFPRIDDSHCDMIHSSLTAAHCLDDGYMGKRWHGKNIVQSTDEFFTNNHDF